MAEHLPAAIAAAADAVAGTKAERIAIAATCGLVHCPRIEPTADTAGEMLPSLMRLKMWVTDRLMDKKPGRTPKRLVKSTGRVDTEFSAARGKAHRDHLPRIGTVVLLTLLGGLTNRSPHQVEVGRERDPLRKSWLGFFTVSA